jgi:ferrous iron transport protein B
MGTIILLASVVIWALGYFPHNSKNSSVYDEQINLINTNMGISENTRTALVNNVEMNKQSAQQENSYIGRLGHFIEPAIRPLGFDWKIGVSIITGLAAKEIVVSTMGILYQANPGDNGDGSVNLQTRLQEQTYQKGSMKGQKVFTPLVAYGFMLFVLIYFPCIATLTAIKKESDLKWAGFNMFVTTVIAWIAAFVTYQVGSLFV